MSVAGWLFAYFLFVLASTLAAGWYWMKRAAAEAPARGGPSGPPLLGDPELQETQAAFAGIFQTVGSRMAAGKEDGHTRRQLMAAGHRYASAVAIFLGIKICFAAFCALLLGVATWYSRGEFFYGFMGAVAGGGFAWLLSDRLLTSRVRSRRDRIRQAVPAALDLMVMTVEAGQSINQAILDASIELAEAYPDLSSELAQVHLELRAGKARGDALRRLGERNGEPELRKLSNLLIDSDRFGTSLAPALRTHARYLRIRTRQGAQEAARKVAVKLVFPVFFLIFPSLLLVTLGPAVLQLTTQLNEILR
jgi:tight adherence protein C